MSKQTESPSAGAKPRTWMGLPNAHTEAANLLAEAERLLMDELEHANERIVLRESGEIDPFGPVAFAPGEIEDAGALASEIGHLRRRFAHREA